MSARRPSLRRWHRLLGLLVGVPCLLWGGSGAILAWKHYAELVPPGNPAKVAGDRTPFTVPVEQALALAGHGQGQGGPPQSLEWHWVLGHPYYVVRYEAVTVRVDGQHPHLLPVPAVDEALARRIAQADAPEGVTVSGCSLKTGHTPVYRGDLPAYRVSLSNGDDVYISLKTGEIEAHVDTVYRVIRGAYFGCHIWDLSQAPGRHASFVLLGLMALGLCCLGLSGLWLAIGPLVTGIALRQWHHPAASPANEG